MIFPNLQESDDTKFETVSGTQAYLGQHGVR